ncbi:MAG: hypothetical protein DRJ15_16395 [Bacteroidetes bacterium]|nr:MAG: hypothetical protein DRJ15_16395 [Bacteroidota bacterium]
MKRFRSPFAFIDETDQLIKLKSLVATNIEGEPQAVFTQVEVDKAIAMTQPISFPLFSEYRALRGLQMIEHKPTLQLTYKQ